MFVTLSIDRIVAIARLLLRLAHSIRETRARRYAVCCVSSFFLYYDVSMYVFAA